MNLNRGDSLAIFVCSFSSIISCASIVLTFLISPSRRAKAHKQVLFHLALANLLSGIGSIVGEPLSRSSACVFEAVVTHVAALAIVFWTVVLCALICSSVVDGKAFNIDYRYHLLCWGFAIIVTVLPLINSTYGARGEYSLCFLVGTNATPKPWGLSFWYWISFYGWIWCGAIISIAFAAQTFRNRENIRTVAKAFTLNTFMKVILYPFIVIICWILPTYFDMIFLKSGENSYTAPAISKVLPCLQGTFTAIVFWCTSNAIRKNWIKFVATGELRSMSGSGLISVVRVPMGVDDPSVRRKHGLRGSVSQGAIIDSVRIGRRRSIEVRSSKSQLLSQKSSTKASGKSAGLGTPCKPYVDDDHNINDDEDAINFSEKSASISNKSNNINNIDKESNSRLTISTTSLAMPRSNSAGSALHNAGWLTAKPGGGAGQSSPSYASPCAATTLLSSSSYKTLASLSSGGSFSGSGGRQQATATVHVDDETNMDCFEDKDDLVFEREL